MIPGLAQGGREQRYGIEAPQRAVNKTKQTEKAMSMIAPILHIPYISFLDVYVTLSPSITTH